MSCDRRAQISSQYLTALLLAAPLADGDIDIEIVDELVSVPYVAMTIEWMRRFGAEVTINEDYSKFHICGGVGYKSPGYAYVEGDASSASYFLTGAAITGAWPILESSEK